MDLNEALLGRRTVQRFREGAVPETVLQRALAAANRAPNHKLTWPWRFTLPGPRTRGALFEIGLRLKAGGNPPSADLEAKVRSKLLVPDRLVVVSQVIAEDAFREREDYAACACAVQNLMLSLHGDGVGSKWSTGGLTTDPDTYRVLDIDSGAERIIAFVWVGMADGESVVPRRRDLDELVRRLP